MYMETRVGTLTLVIPNTSLLYPMAYPHGNRPNKGNCVQDLSLYVGDPRILYRLIPIPPIIDAIVLCKAKSCVAKR